MLRIKKGDTVFVRTGQDKGKTGRVLFVDVDKDTILVEGVNKRKRHQRPTQRNPKGGIVSKEAPVHISNVALYDSSSGGPVKFSSKVTMEDGRRHKARVNKKTGEEI
jgi:large subunit ribosomal protein L24